MDEATMTIDGVDYVGVILNNGWWICYRCDDPLRMLRYVQALPLESAAPETM